MCSSASLKSLTRYDYLAALFALLLQIQLTVFSTETYSGIRVNAADFLIPFLGFFILFSLLSKKSFWPDWRKPFGYWCLVLLTVVLAYGLINGYLLRGEISQWALVNKFTGWFVLCAYIGAAGWLATNAPGNIVKSFYIAFLSVFCLLTFIALVQFFVFRELGNDIFGHILRDFHGFMYNRNAYAFLFIAVLLSSLFVSSQRKYIQKTEKFLHICLWVMLPATVYFNGSRALWLCLLFLIPMIFIYYKSVSLKYVVLCIVIGSALLFVLFPNSLPKGLKTFHQTIMLFIDEEDRAAVADRLKTQNDYNDVRFRTIETGLDLVQEHPVRGAGLGSIIEVQKEQNVDMVSVLDNTLLWVLVEMGPFGLLSFLLVYMVMIKSMIGGSFKSMSNEAKFGLSLMLFFGLFSLFHEILYTRFFWFICAMLMVAPNLRDISTETRPR